MIIKDKRTRGWIKTIKYLSFKPSEFITTASEFLYNWDIVKIIARKSDSDRINEASLIILKLTKGISSCTGIPRSILSWTIKTNWLPNKTNPIMKNIAKNRATRLRLIYLAIREFWYLRILRSFVCIINQLPTC